MSTKFYLTVGILVFLFSVTYAQDFDDKLNDAKISMMEGNYEAGLKLCEDLIAIGSPDSSQLSLAYAYAGMASEVLKHNYEALKYYSTAVGMKVPQLDIYDKLISLSKSEKNDSIYEFALLEKLKAWPDYEESIVKSLATQYAKTTQYEKLLNVSNVLLGWYPDEVKYLFYKAVALQNLNQNDEAKEYYSKILELDPDHPGANMSIGLLLYNKGSEIFSKRKQEYEAIAKPDRVDYAEYNRGIEKGKELYRQAAPYLIKAYNSGSYPSLKRVLFNLYVLLEEKDKAEPYR